jgi:hypothetical protein
MAHHTRYNEIGQRIFDAINHDQITRFQKEWEAEHPDLEITNEDSLATLTTCALQNKELGVPDWSPPVSWSIQFRKK